MNGVIYKITNIENKKSYIGQTIHAPEKRFKEHLNRALREETFYPLANAIRKYGKDSFVIEILGEYQANELNDWEKYWINYYNTFERGYNATIGGNYIPTINKVIYDSEKICTQYENGKSIVDIAQEQNMGQQTVSNILRNKGVKILTAQEFIAKKEKKEFSAYNHYGVKVQSFLTPAQAYLWLLEQNLAIEHIPSNLRTCGTNIAGTLREKQGGLAYGYFWSRGVKENIEVNIPTRYKTLYQQVKIESIKTSEQKIFTKIDEVIVFFIDNELTKAKPIYVKRSIMQAIKHNKAYLGYMIKFI